MVHPVIVVRAGDVFVGSNPVTAIPADVVQNFFGILVPEEVFLSKLPVGPLKRRDRRVVPQSLQVRIPHGVWGGVHVFAGLAGFATHPTHPFLASGSRFWL